tara:strand:+ start:87 stop:305 length:219 start_codon:yes stop_codon:yes gene_type:complete
MKNNKLMGTRGLVTYYKKIIKEGRVSENGSTYKRMVELETKLNNRTGQASSYEREKKNANGKSLGWLTKVMN